MFPPWSVVHEERFQKGATSSCVSSKLYQTLKDVQGMHLFLQCARRRAHSKGAGDLRKRRTGEDEDERCNTSPAALD